MTRQELDEFGRVTLDAGGNGQVSIQPDGVTVWHITRMVVSTNQSPTSTPIPTCKVYTNFVGEGQEIDTTYTGNQDASDCNIRRQPSSPIIARWENGIPGSTGVFSVYGERMMA